MLPEIVAIFSAMGWAGDSVLVRLGARKSNILAAMLVSFSISATCIWSYLLLFSSLDFLRSPAMYYFLVSGCLQPLVARALFYVGLTRMGVSRAGPLRGAEPLFAAAIAVIFLHERPTMLVYVGTILIVASVWVISWTKSGQAHWRPIDLAFPLGAALVSAVSQNLRKRGLLILPDPFVATVITTSMSLALFLIYLFSARKTNLLRMDRESAPFFIGAAFIATLAQVLNFVALGRGEVSVIIPLLNTSPLFTVFFSSIFLQGVEKVSLRIVLGAILMVAGMATIASR